jgi:hypothetical protein
VLGCLEEANPRVPGLKPYLLLIVIVGAGLLCLFSFRRYSRMLLRAQDLAEQSVCPDCRVYGLLKVLKSRASPGLPERHDGLEHDELAVECRKCARQWTMGPR